MHGRALDTGYDMGYAMCICEAEAYSVVLEEDALGAHNQGAKHGWLLRRVCRRKGDASRGHAC